MPIFNQLPVFTIPASTYFPLQ